MPKDQGEACSLLAFCDSSHGWLDHLVVSMFLPCLEAMSASPYRLNRLHTFLWSLEQLYKPWSCAKVQEISYWLLPPPRMQGDGL